jgi:hypothetical protein
MNLPPGFDLSLSFSLVKTIAVCFCNQSKAPLENYMGQRYVLISDLDVIFRIFEEYLILQ